MGPTSRLLPLLLGLAWPGRSSAQLNLPDGTCYLAPGGSGDSTAQFCIGRDDATPPARQLAPHSSGIPGSTPAGASAGTTSKFNMFIQTEMLSWGSWDGVQSLLKGTLQVHMVWPSYAEKFVENPWKLVDVDNLADGKVMQHSVLDITHGDTAYKTMLVRYLGSFKQEDQSSCYPFDRLRVSFQLDIPPPANYVFNAVPLCTGPGMIAYDWDGNVVEEPLNGNVARCEDTRTDGKAAAGLTWETIVCQQVPGNPAMIECSTTGIRVYSRLLQAYLLPSVATSIMSFLSFKMAVKMTMPRVATTMIAMLTQINLKIAISKTQSTVGFLSWLDFYLQNALIMCLINLIGHVLAFWCDGKGYTTAVQLVDECFFELGMCLAVIVPLARLFAQDDCYKETYVPVAATILALSSLFFIYHSVMDVRKYWAPFKEWYYMAQAEAEEMRMQLHKMAKITSTTMDDSPREKPPEDASPKADPQPTQPPTSLAVAPLEVKEVKEVKGSLCGSKGCCPDQEVEEAKHQSDKQVQVDDLRAPPPRGYALESTAELEPREPSGGSLKL